MTYFKVNYTFSCSFLYLFDLCYACLLIWAPDRIWRPD